MQVFRSQADSHKRLMNESWCSLAHDTDVGLVTTPMLIQKLHSAVVTRQVSHEDPEPRAVNCVLENLDTCGLGEVLLKGDAGSAIQTLVDPAWVGRGERTMADKAVRKIESFAKTCVSVLPERFGCQVNSEGIASPWVVGCVAHVLSQSEKRHDDQNVRFQLKMRECRGVLKQAGGAVDHGTVYGKMAKLDAGRATGTSLDRTDANGERPPHRCTTSEQWQRDVFTNRHIGRYVVTGANLGKQALGDEIFVSRPPTGVPRNARELADWGGEANDRNFFERKETEEVDRMETSKKEMEKGDDKMCKYSQLHMSVERERKDHTTSRLQ